MLNFLKRKKTPDTDKIRNIVFGAEDSLVSTVGVMVGVATASGDRKVLLITGIVVIAVEALSMGIGSFLSEETAKESGDKGVKPVQDGLYMFFSYLLAGLIPISPYLLMDAGRARTFSVGMSLVALLIIGYLPAKNARAGVRMALLGGAAILVGYIIGLVGNSYIHA